MDEIVSQVVYNREPLILATVETHVTEEIGDHELQIGGYNEIRCNTSNSRTGGIIVYVKDNIQTKIVAAKEINLNTWLSIIKIGNHAKENIIVCTLYHSPNASDAEFIDIIKELGEHLIEFNKVIIVGDFNIDISKNDYYAKKLIDAMYSYGFSQYVLENTRITNKSNTLIDLVFSNFNVTVKIKHTPKITDHSMLVINTELENM